MLDQVVEYGDGWMPTGPDAMEVAPIDELRRRCDKAGRDFETITLGAYAPKADLATLETLAERGFSWAALMVRPYDELSTLDRYLPLLERFGPLG
jgi:alkanesulfonate monooxygenase SsuD/methylene tetrahydromethanopterin reductase-like flavin-dependent oxidoreductase (luciferase family)